MPLLGLLLLIGIYTCVHTYESECDEFFLTQIYEISDYIYKSRLSVLYEAVYEDRDISKEEIRAAVNEELIGKNSYEDYESICALNFFDNE